MRLRNLKISNIDIPNKDMVIDSIKELELLINDNYHQILDKEIGIEFNIGSKLGEPREYLVVYVNPNYVNNPYVFILRQTKEGKKLTNNTSLESFKHLADNLIRQEVNKSIAIGFRNLPHFAFLGIGQIQKAREFAEEYDMF